ncbi:MAG: hypothetical protein QOD40_1551 [Alphaproteobacteria bacterium]|jgi:lysophospholipase L1-like esterase|nr:hypothetical protein [Alphaproteobacteria bacterium]
MKVLVGALLVGSLLITPAGAQQADCDLPGNLLYGESPLNRVAAAAKATHHLGIAIIGTGSSAITGDGSAHAYPARLEAALTRRLSGVTVKVTAHTKSGQTAEQMLEDLEKVLADEKPALVVWQTGTVDAMRGVEPDAFGTALNDGVETIQSAGADVVLMNMQYSPRTETMIADSAYAENMRWAAQQRDVPLFDRLGIMRYWSDTGVFDFHAATKAFVTAQKVHECIGRALAAQIIDAAHLGPMTSKVLQ